MRPIDKKSALILGGPVKVASTIALPFRVSRSTAGPGAGSTGIVLSFEGMRVKKAISADSGEFELMAGDDGFYLLRNGKAFLDQVNVEPVAFHAPEQAFFNLDNRCIYGCSFCASPLIGEGKGHTPGKVVRMIIDAHAKEAFDAVAITSGVPDTPEATVERIIEVVEGVRKALPEVTIGAEPYVSSIDQIDRLKDAGVDEIKLNIETFDRELFMRVCGRKDLDQIMGSIAHAVEVLGRGKVTSNIIVGMGESDENVLEGVETLARMGCVATLRALRTNGINLKALKAALGDRRPVDEARLIRLARAQRDILERHGLSTLSFRTMCGRCSCCDLNPFVDLG